MTDCVFCKIVSGTLPSNKVYEDEDFIIIPDLYKQARLHFLLIPKMHYANLFEQTEEDGVKLGKMLHKLPQILSELGFSNGYRLITNCGQDGRQSVFHLHIHILGGEKLTEKFGIAEK